MPVADVAAWMRDALRKRGVLYQEEAAAEIEQRFGEEFLYTTANGNPGINKMVLREFRSLTKEWAVWVSGERCWRHREETDPKGTRKAE